MIGTRIPFGHLFGLGLALAPSACGSSTASDTPDAAPVASGADAAPPADLAVPAQGFQLRSPDIVMPAGTEQTFCYYFTLPNTAAAGVKRWESQMTPGSHHLIVFLTPDQEEPDGTLVSDCAGFGSSVTNIPIWTFSSQTLYQDGPLPDGVGMTISGSQHGFIQMHYLNATDEDATVHVTVNGYTFDPGTTYIPAAAYVTYNTNISIPAGVGMTGSAEGSCTVPTNLNFFAMSTHSHRRSVDTWIEDGTSMLLMSDNWQHPTIDSWPAPSFYHFSGKLTYHCDYVNDLPTAVHEGPSAQTDEMCMAVGYFFPATKPIFCLNSTVVPL